EGGINLSAIQASTCFPTFIAETRSSAGPESGLSLQAQLKDLAFGQFQKCGSETKTTPEDASGTPISAPLSIGKGTVGVEDKAEVTVKGTSTWSGTVQFELCGPIPSTDTSQTCDGTTNVGTKIGGAKEVSNTANVVTSPLVTVTSVGKYCWRAV